MLAPNKNPAALADKNTELAVRLKVSEEQIRLLREENQRLKQVELAHEQLKSEHQQTVERKVLLEEEVRWLKAQYYGRSTQSTDAAEQNADQQMLFNEAEVLAAIEAADEAHRQRTTKIDAHERKRSADAGRKAIPDHFPRIEIEHDLAPEHKLCTKCAVPHPLTRIGQEIRECYRFEPPRIRVEQHIRPTYVCEERHEAPITAPAPPVILPKSMASPSLLAHIINSKYNLGLPLYRVSQDFKRYRMDLGPGTLGTWVSTVGGENIVPVINLIRDALFAAPFMHIDETPLQILRSDKAVGSDHYIVVRAGGPPGQRIILYDYLASRTTEGLKQFFIGPDGAYQGKLISDGLERYDDIAAQLKLLHFGCLTHCRTMFFKARKVSQLPSSRTLANAAIEDYIGPVYHIEGQIKALRAEYQQRGEPLSLETVLQLRQQKSKPILEKFKAWIDDLLPGTPPNSALGKALGYAHRQWPKLVRHLDHAEIPVDNNYSEQQIKHFATGRKAWLFSYDASNAQASANLFSLVMTCRVNDVEPYAYLNYIFEHLPAASTVEQIEALLPWNLKSMLDEQKKSSIDSNPPSDATSPTLNP
ncbi:MAG: IS66 family transposase [Steroidobacteraceae bacterium]